MSPDGHASRAPVALSARNDRLKRLRRLVRQSKARSAERAFVVDGPTLVAEAIRSSASIEALYVGSKSGPELLQAVAADLDDADLDDAAGLDTTTVYEVEDGVLTSILDPANPRPMAAVVASRSWQLADLAPDGPVLVAVEVRDPGNLGALLRTAEAAGCAGVVVVGPTVDHGNPKTVRSSAGSIFRLPVVVQPDQTQAVAQLKATGRQIVASVVGSDRRAEDYDRCDLRKAAILVGNEPHGLPSGLVDLADVLVTIPMAGDVESLNVAAAAAVLVFESARQRRREPVTGRIEAEKSL